MDQLTAGGLQGQIALIERAQIQSQILVLIFVILIKQVVYSIVQVVSHLLHVTLMLPREH